MDFVNEKNDLLVCLQLVDDGLQSLFELSTILRAGNNACKVEHYYTLIVQQTGNFVLHYTQGQSFDDSALAYTGKTNKDGIILFTTTQYLRHTLYLAIATYDRVKQSVLRRFGEVGTKGVQGRCARTLTALLAGRCLLCRRMSGTTCLVEIAIAFLIIFILIRKTEACLRVLFLRKRILDGLIIQSAGRCPNLTAAPELPATELAEECYRRMFAGCTNLTAAPELPATELAESCYSGMFDNCRSLHACR